MKVRAKSRIIYDGAVYDADKEFECAELIATKLMICGLVRKVENEPELEESAGLPTLEEMKRKRK